MTAHRPLYPIESQEQAPTQQEAAVFVRTFSTPPGLPWDQNRVAVLEARSGAPLPLTEVTYQLRRLDRWSVGRPARFAAFYVRVQEASRNLERIVEVHGRSMRVRFISPVQRSRRARRLGLLALAVGSIATVASGAVTAALAVRQETATRLDMLAEIAAAKQKSMREVERQRLLSRSLDVAAARSTNLSVVLDDLAWASAAKAPDAHIEALHWEHGYMAVEVRGEAAPFLSADRTIIKAPKPLRLHLWLWGVEPKGQRP